MGPSPSPTHRRSAGMRRSRAGSRWSPVALATVTRPSPISRPFKPAFPAAKDSLQSHNRRRPCGNGDDARPLGAARAPILIEEGAMAQIRDARAAGFGKPGDPGRVGDFADDALDPMTDALEQAPRDAGCRERPACFSFRRQR